MLKLRAIREDPKESCSLRLKELKPWVIAEDRKQAMSEYNITYVTVCRYLKGKVGNPALGIKLVNLFVSLINQRTQQISVFPRRIGKARSADKKN